MEDLLTQFLPVSVLDGFGRSTYGYFIIGVGASMIVYMPSPVINHNYPQISQLPGSQNYENNKKLCRKSSLKTGKQCIFTQLSQKG